MAAEVDRRIKQFDPTSRAHMYAALLQTQEGIDAPFAGADLGGYPPTPPPHFTEGEFSPRLSEPSDDDDGLDASAPTSPAGSGFENRSVSNFEASPDFILDTPATRASFEEARRGGIPAYNTDSPFQPRRASFEEPRRQQRARPLWAQRQNPQQHYQHQHQHKEQQDEEAWEQQQCWGARQPAYQGYTNPCESRPANPSTRQQYVGHADRSHVDSPIAGSVNLAPLYYSPAQSTASSGPFSRAESTAAKDSEPTGWLGLPQSAISGASSPASSTVSGYTQRSRGSGTLGCQGNRSPVLGKDGLRKEEERGRAGVGVAVPLYSSVFPRPKPLPSLKPQLMPRDQPGDVSGEESADCGSSFCLNFEEAQSLCEDKELDKEKVEGISIVPLRVTSTDEGATELVLYALYFASSGPVPQLPGNAAGRRLFPPLWQLKARQRALAARQPR